MLNKPAISVKRTTTYFVYNKMDCSSVVVIHDTEAPIYIRCAIFPNK